VQAHASALPPTKMLLTVEEAARCLSVGRTLLYTLMMRHEIASIKVGRTRRIPVVALREFVSRELGELRELGGPGDQGTHDHARGNV
jgi:excisionase family DNA binding protein